jgi:ribosomal protein S18 acetylase RimI-like enzyme
VQSDADTLRPDYACVVPEAASIGELTRPEFLARLDELLAIYVAAMGADPSELPSRRAIMERHAGNPGFRALGVSSPNRPQFVAFCYGFRGAPGQWWHDVVRAGIQAASGVRAADSWLDDVMEVAEVHVDPAYQARGIGRSMLLQLADGRPERTALLSTRDSLTPARRLYRSLGFTDLLTDFSFPGGGMRYAVMGAELPLARGAGAVAAGSA